MPPEHLHVLLAAEEDLRFDELEALLRGLLLPGDRFMRVTQFPELLESLDPPTPRLVFLSSHLPDGEGIVALRQVRKFLQGSPVVVISEDSDLTESALALGSAAVISPAEIHSSVLRSLISFGRRTLYTSRLLNQERDFLRNLLENIPDRIYFKDRDSRFLRISEATCRLFNLASPADAIGKNDFDIFTAEHAREAFEDEQEMLRSGTPLISKMERETFPDGRSTWALTTKMPMRNRHGEVVGTFGISRDVTQLKEMEEALARERNLLRSLMDNLPDQIYVKDAEGRYILDNPAHLRRLGVSGPEEVIGKTVFDLFPADSAARYTADDRHILRTGEPLEDHEELIPDGLSGESRWHLTSKLPLLGPDGNVEALVCISRDIHEQKVAENRLRETLAELRESHEQLKAAQLHLIQAEKMESVGRLAAGIAHEVKNPLATIRMGIEYLSRMENQHPEAKTILHEMDRAVSRADQVIREMLDFSAARDLDRRPTSVHDVVKGALGLLRSQLQQLAIEVTTDLAEDLPSLKIDRMKIEQVLVNLLMNAAHAMPKGGELHIHAFRSLMEHPSERDAGDRSGISTRAARSAVVIEVTDSGTGIPEDKMPRIFDPFFTTKPTGVGTGLGLSVCAKIMELHGGAIRMKNRTDRPGAVARILLPIEPTTNPPPTDTL